MKKSLIVGKELVEKYKKRRVEDGINSSTIGGIMENISLYKSWEEEVEEESWFRDWWEQEIEEEEMYQKSWIGTKFKGEKEDK